METDDIFKRDYAAIHDISSPNNSLLKRNSYFCPNINLMENLFDIVVRKVYYKILT